jgi:hypothetical protein
MIYHTFIHPSFGPIQHAQQQQLHQSRFDRDHMASNMILYKPYDVYMVILLLNKTAHGVIREREPS